MSKRAEEAQASAILPESIISYAKEHAVLSGLVYREGVKFGYERAEKDLALTWEDIKYIVQTFHHIICVTKNITSDEGCVKTLQIFNEQRENNDTQRNP